MNFWIDDNHIEICNSIFLWHVLQLKPHLFLSVWIEIIIFKW